MAVSQVENDCHHVRLFIDGAWRDGAGRDRLDIVNPATEAVIGSVAKAEQEDLAAAVEAASEGLKVWRATSAFDRSQILLKAAALLRERSGHIGRLLTLEQGKPLAQATFEATRAAGELEWAAAEGLRAYGRVIPARNGSALQATVRQPVGVVALFSPWNFPINQLTRKVAPALAAGCAIVAKAPEETPAAPAELVRALSDAGVPKGVVNLVFGVPAEISRFLIDHPEVRKISFTGSVPVGKLLAEQAGRQMKRVTMELGGHAPVIIHADADLDFAVERFAQMKLFNGGQTCATPNRFIVHQDVYEAFVSRFSSRIAQTRIGNGLDETSQLGPLANARRLAAMETFVEDARQRQGRIVTGGHRVGNEGYFFAPTVVTDLPEDSLLRTVEAFGPIAVVSSFKTEDEAIREANRLPYGLAAYAVTRSSATIQRLVAEVECGSLIINESVIGLPEMPFGGVKDSGYGAEGGSEGLDAYLSQKLVHLM